MTSYTFKTVAGAKRAATIVEKKLVAMRDEVASSAKRPHSKAKAVWQGQQAIVLPFLAQLKTIVGTKKGIRNGGR